MNTAFDSRSTADDVLAGRDLRGTRVLVTGTTSGIGTETARSLVARGADVIGTVRSNAASQAVNDIIRAAADAGGGSFETVELDLGSLSSVRDCADHLIAEGAPIDAIIANAGVGVPPFSRTEDGFELQFGVNHLGHFVLINRLVPLLREGSRVIVLSSAAHRFGDTDFSDANFEHAEYDPFLAYSRSKSANALFALEFDARHRADGIHAASVHPGAILDTKLHRHAPHDPDQAPPSPDDDNGIPASEMKSAPQGAATSVWAAFVADGEELRGRYCMDCAVAQVNPDRSSVLGVLPEAQDPDTARALWKLSEGLVAERFD